MVVVSLPDLPAVLEVVVVPGEMSDSQMIDLLHFCKDSNYNIHCILYDKSSQISYVNIFIFLYIVLYIVT